MFWGQASESRLGFATQDTFWSAVDLQAAVMTRICEALGMVQFEHNAMSVRDKSMVDGVIRPEPGQTGEQVPPRRVACEVALSKMLSRVLSAVEAVQAAKLTPEMPLMQQATMLSAGGPGSPTHIPRNTLQASMIRMADLSLRASICCATW